MVAYVQEWQIESIIKVNFEIKTYLVDECVGSVSQRIRAVHTKRGGFLTVGPCVARLANALHVLFLFFIQHRSAFGIVFAQILACLTRVQFDTAILTCIQHVSVTVLTNKIFVELSAIAVVAKQIGIELS
jgi:hypothetical protein